MIIKTNATLVNGQLRLDQPLDLPDQTRFEVILQTEEIPPEEIPQAQPTEAERKEAWMRFIQWIEEHPVDSGGHHFTRDELHERR